MSKPETLSSVDRPPDKELSPRLSQELQLYLDCFYKRVKLSPEAPLSADEIKEFVLFRAGEIIERNNGMAEILSSPKYNEIIKKEKEELRGPCALGICQCIDGRLYPLLFGRIASCWETGAGEVKIKASPLDGQPQLASARLRGAIINRARRGELLEILFAHNSGVKNVEEFDCGAMKAKQAQGLLPPDCDLIEENLKIHQESGQAITALFNHTAQVYNRPPLKRVAITAVIDTKTMGVMLGYGQENSFFTTDLLTDPAFIENLKDALQKEYQTGLYSLPGIMRDQFTDPSLSLIREKMTYDVTRVLTEYDQFADPLEEYLKTNLSDLTQDQQQALTFLLARTLAFQYLTGLYKEQDHPFAYHGEEYLSLSLDGVFPGQFDPEQQVFGASPDTAQDAVSLILTECQLMDKVGKTAKPYLLFIAKASSQDSPAATLERDQGKLWNLYTEILEDDEIFEKIKTGQLAIVPVLINRKTREVFEIVNLAL